MTRPIRRELLILVVATVAADMRALLCRCVPWLCTHGLDGAK